MAMSDEWLAERFETNRTHLRAVAMRMLGSREEADDAVQEAWLRMSRADTSEVENLSGWLTTVVARVCLDMLRSRRSRREDPLDVDEHGAVPSAAADPEQEALHADAVGLALLVVLDTLAPAERLAFVLHDMFAVPFEEIATIVDRTPAAARQLASRARRRVQGASPGVPDGGRRREVVDAFLAASRGGDFQGLLNLLDPQAVFRADGAGVRMGSQAELVGAQAVAENFAGRARAAKLALVDGLPAAVWMQGGVPRVVFAFTVDDGKVTAIDLVADPEHLAAMDITMLG
jgi:RNA polymerase sigma-70 factor (ECF subfamily)